MEGGRLETEEEDMVPPSTAKAKMRETNNTSSTWLTKRIAGKKQSGQVEIDEDDTAGGEVAEDVEGDWRRRVADPR